MTGWELKTLGEVIRLEYGKPLAPSDRNPKGQYPVYGANGEKDRTDKFYRDQPSIIVGRKGSAGEITLTEERFWPLDVTYFAEFDRQRYDLQFLYYLLTTLDLPSLAKGVKPGINRNEVYAVPVMVPSMPEQRRIVTILDEAFEGIATAKANAEKNLQNARGLFEVRVKSTFVKPGDGWEVCALGTVCEMYQPKTITGKDLVADGPYLVFGANGEIGRYTAYNHEEPEVLVTCRGATCGAINFSAPKSWVTGNAMVVRPRDGVLDKSFLEHLLRNGVDLSAAITGAAQPQITRTNLAPLIITFPKRVEEQRYLTAAFDEMQMAVDGLRDIYSRRLAALDELKKSLLHQAFTGAL